MINYLSWPLTSPLFSFFPNKAASLNRIGFNSIVLLDQSMSRDGETQNAFVVDWECLQLGRREDDVGQMLAEMYELKLFRGLDAGLWLASSMLSTYGTDGSDEFAFRVALCIGQHLVQWGPRAGGWGTAEQVNEVLTVGRDIIVHSWAKDRAWFEGGDLAFLFQARSHKRT